MNRNTLNFIIWWHCLNMLILGHVWVFKLVSDRYANFAYQPDRVAMAANEEAPESWDAPLKYAPRKK